MKIIVDAQLSPHLAVWISQQFEMEAFSVKFLGLRDADDTTIFEKARELNAIVLTKDNDFLRLLDEKGSPPKIIWVTCGNTSNDRMREILIQHLENALKLLETADLVEMTD
jgi:predicted nuclease of predicted toxin-antitoxin system